MGIKFDQPSPRPVTSVPSGNGPATTGGHTRPQGMVRYDYGKYPSESGQVPAPRPAAKRTGRSDRFLNRYTTTATCVTLRFTSGTLKPLWSPPTGGLCASPNSNRARARRPDLIIAFNVRPADYRASNGYIVSEQGKPPDFVMEIASASTADVDTGVKRGGLRRPGHPGVLAFRRGPAPTTAADWQGTSWMGISTGQCP